MIVEITETQIYEMTTTTEAFLFKIPISVGDYVTCENVTLIGGQDIIITPMNGNQIDFHVGEDPLNAGGDFLISEVGNEEYYNTKYIENNRDGMTLKCIDDVFGYIFFRVEPDNPDNTVPFTTSLSFKVPVQRVYRLVKNEPLTALEHDNNLDALSQKIDDSNEFKALEDIQYLTIGTTDERPSTSILKNGFFYFDTTLNKPIWLKVDIYDTDWVDATGASV